MKIGRMNLFMSDKMKILMTGSDGYIGSNLKPYLEMKGMSVFPYVGDICDFPLRRKSNNPDMVIHLAALTGVRRSLEISHKYKKVNVFGTRRIFEYAENCNIPLLLSNKSMEAVGFIWDFRKCEMKVNNRYIKLKRTKSGHYALPISL